MFQTIPYTHKVSFINDGSNLYMQIPEDVHGFLESINKIDKANSCRSDPYYYYTYPAWSNKHKPLIGEVSNGAYKARKFYGEGDWVKQTVYSDDDPKIRFWSPAIHFLTKAQAEFEINKDYSKPFYWYNKTRKWSEAKISKSHLALLRKGLLKKLKAFSTLSPKELEHLLEVQIRRISHKF